MDFAQNFGDVVGTYEGCLPLSEDRWGYDSTLKWRGHLTTIIINSTHLNFLHQEEVGSKKLKLLLAISLMPKQSEISEVMLIARAREPPLWNLHDIFLHLSLVPTHMEIHGNVACFKSHGKLVELKNSSKNLKK